MQRKCRVAQTEGGGGGRGARPILPALNRSGLFSPLKQPFPFCVFRELEAKSRNSMVQGEDQNILICTFLHPRDFCCCLETMVLEACKIVAHLPCSWPVPL